MNKISIFAAFGLLTLSGISFALPAHAIPSLLLTEGANVVTVSDNGIGDINTDVGTLAFSGNVGSFYVPIALGVTKPILGTSTNPSINLVSLQVGGGSAITSSFPKRAFSKMAR